MSKSLPLCFGLLFALNAVTFAQNSAPDARQFPPPSSQSTNPPDTQQPPVGPQPEVTEPPPLPDSPSASKSKKSKSAKEVEEERKEQSQKIFGVVPQFTVTSRRDAPALAPREKFDLMFKSVVNPFEFAATGFQAALAQATDEFPEYGQGAEGYGKRYGASFADQASSQFFSNYFYPVLFKQDPRYFRLGEGTLRHRVLYSLAQEFSAIKDDRTRQFNYSNVLGAFTSGAVSNVYYPSKERGLENTLSRSLIAIAYGSAGGIVSEFWPDVQQKWAAHRAKKKEQRKQK